MSRGRARPRTALLRVLLLGALLLAVGLAGCSGGGKDDEVIAVRPEEITERDLTRIENLASKFPTRYSFPDAIALPPVLGLFFNGTLGPGTGSTGIELPNDDGPLDYGGVLERFDLSAQVPVGQPVEVRAFLKWWGDPGSSADLDIWADMPGTHDAFHTERYDESMNWNIINKQRVVDAVHLEGQPFELGLQVNNGRIVHPDGVRYSLRVDLYFADGVLGPGAASAIQVPQNASGLVLKTERVTGDEHVDVSFLLIGPDDQLVRHLQHNDIGVDTLFLPVKQPGEHIVYAHHMHGGFIRLESEVPNPDSQARRLEMSSTDVTLFEGGAPAPGTYAESGVGGNTWGAEGQFDVGPGFPLDVTPFLHSTAGSIEAAINVTSPSGWVGTAFACNSVADGAPPYCFGYEDGSGRVGSTADVRHDRSHLAVGSYSYGVVSNGPGVVLGVTVLGYTR
ncbi:MAG TPA: hypothetical protein VM327_09410 [Candidatus Thermoplasmatota archaeon]|nr:hypothetical protein [Candidatus Thermoplasmatota archaeon]